MLTFITANLNRSIKICNKNHVIRRLPGTKGATMQDENEEGAVKKKQIKKKL